MAARCRSSLWDFIPCAERSQRLPSQPGASRAGSPEHTLGSRLFLCTQNVDNLHEQAGSRRSTCHGELFKSRCKRLSLPFDDTNIYHEVPAIVRVAEEIRRIFCCSAKRPFVMESVSCAPESARSSLQSGLQGWSHLQRVSSADQARRF